MSSSIEYGAFPTVSNDIESVKNDFHTSFTKCDECVEMSQQSQNDSLPMSLEETPINTENSIDGFLSLSGKQTSNIGNLRAVDELPRKYQCIFSSYPSFNALQSKVLDDVISSDKPVVISAPTGSGKTVIFELAIVRLFLRIEELKDVRNFIIVYLAPVKALCTERFRDWRAKFSPLGLTCQEVTGDSNTSDLTEISKCNILLTTPEKWDSLTRNWREKQYLVQIVKLFLIDEVHLVSEEKRGPVLEAIVSRMKTIQETLACQHDVIPLRFIAVSATIPNVRDVACWLGTITSPALSFALSEEFRPVKLNKLVFGYDCPSNFTQFRFEIQLSYKLKPLLFKYAEQKPALIFCSTRKGVIQTTDVLSRQITFHFSFEQQQRLMQYTAAIKENKFKDYVLAGVGCHHAGMDMNDRLIMEDLFRNGYLPVLVTTSTLAMGVNLPAHLVIIKSTQQYVAGCYQDYSENQLLQMIGRAGRPQYDKTATAIIMTKNNKVNRYRLLIDSKDILESCLHKHLPEHLNSEVVLSTITEKAVAINWIRSTFLYVRALHNPKYYGISVTLSEKGIEDKLQEMCLRELNALASINLVKMDIMDVQPTPIGCLMAQHYITFETMKIFTHITGKEKPHEMLAVVAYCHEFIDFQLRTNEKRILNALNKFKDGIRFPLSTPIKTREMKINCLVQASFGSLQIQDPSLHQESIRIIRIGQRVTRCLAKYLSLQTHFQSLLSATLLAKCFHCCMWENSLHVSRQLERIGPVLSACLVASGKTSFLAISESNPRDLERIMNRPSPMGDRIHKTVKHLPRYEVQLKVVQNEVEIKLDLVNINEIEVLNTAGPKHWLVLLAGDSSNTLLLYKRFRDSLLVDNGGQYNWFITVKDLSITKEIFVHIVSETWVGLDVNCSIKMSPDNIMGSHNTQPSMNPPIAKTEKKTPTKNKKKQTVLSQLHDITSGFLESVGNKRFRSSLDVSASQLSLDKFLYTPTRNKKLSHLKSQSVNENENKLSREIPTETGNFDGNGIRTEVHENEKITCQPLDKINEIKKASDHRLCVCLQSKLATLDQKYYPLFLNTQVQNKEEIQMKDIDQQSNNVKSPSVVNFDLGIENLLKSDFCLEEPLTLKDHLPNIQPRKETFSTLISQARHQDEINNVFRQYLFPNIENISKPYLIPSNAYMPSLSARNKMTSHIKDPNEDNRDLTRYLSHNLENTLQKSTLPFGTSLPNLLSRKKTLVTLTSHTKYPIENSQYLTQCLADEPGNKLQPPPMPFDTYFSSLYTRKKNVRNFTLQTRDPVENNKDLTRCLSTNIESTSQHSPVPSDAYLSSLRLKKKNLLNPTSHTKDYNENNRNLTKYSSDNLENTLQPSLMPSGTYLTLTSPTRDSDDESDILSQHLSPDKEDPLQYSSIPTTGLSSTSIIKNRTLVSPQRESSLSPDLNEQPLPLSWVLNPIKFLTSVQRESENTVQNKSQWCSSV